MKYAKAIGSRCEQPESPPSADGQRARRFGSAWIVVLVVLCSGVFILVRAHGRQLDASQRRDGMAVLTTYLQEIGGQMVTTTFAETRLPVGDLLLRPFSARDIEENQIACADPLIQQWLPLPQPYTRQDSSDWCTKISHSLRETGDGIHLVIVDANTDRLLGTVGLKKTDWRGLVSEIGYWVAPWARGRGIAAEATRTIGRWLLIDHGFQRMELKAATGNLASQRAALKAGLQPEGIMRNAGFIHAGRVDLVLFSLTSNDLKPQSDHDGDTRGIS